MKDMILKKLKENKGAYVSGGALAGMLNVSRTAVWKCVSELKSEGCIIESSSRKGYRLVEAPDTISVLEIKTGLDTVLIGKEIHYFDVIDSTNNKAKQLASEGAAEGTAVVAERQTGGRGRLGRRWESAGGKGIWLSVILRPGIAPEEVQVITLAASTAVVSALGSAAGVEAGIKWPNDIILGRKKVCGILTEMNCETDRVNYLVVGIGINIYQLPEDFPEQVRDTAVSLASYIPESLESTGGRAGLPPDFSRNGLIRILLRELDKTYLRLREGKAPEIIEEWKKHSVTLGREVTVSGRNGPYRGTALDVTEDGKLLVRDREGTVREVVSGEISVRGILGYV